MYLTGLCSEAIATLSEMRKRRRKAQWTEEAVKAFESEIRRVWSYNSALLGTMIANGAAAPLAD
jgi:hypothetical protein